MDISDREVEHQFSQPVRQIMTMLVVIVLVGAGGYIAYPRVAPIFLANPYLNGIIIAVFVVGVLACFWQVFQLISSVNWIVGFSQDVPGHEYIKAPRLLAPLAQLFRSREARMQISPTSARSILDSVSTRIDEARDITRYISNLLIFLGLLGTFYGLATTVPAVVDTIRSLAPTEGDSGLEVFAKLMTGLEAQLGGMGTAFASSLLGLAGSLVVGLLELFASHGQNRFFRELEEWVSTITRISFSGSDSDGQGEISSGLGNVLDHMAEQMMQLQQLVAQSDASRGSVNDRLTLLTEQLERMTDRMATDESTTVALNRVADGQERLMAILERRSSDAAQPAGDYSDAESRMRLRSIDVQLLRILEEITAGRQETLSDLRTDLAQLTRTLRQMNLDPREGPAGNRRG